MAQPDLRDLSTDHRNKGSDKPDAVTHTQDEVRQYRQSQKVGGLWLTHKGHKDDHSGITPHPDANQ